MYYDKFINSSSNVLFFLINTINIPKFRKKNPCIEI